MAGPLSSEEIEDVVSSVRRLVSNEQRPRTLSRDLNAERLLLTPAQRVMPETSPLAPLMLDASLQDTQPADAVAGSADPVPSPAPAVPDIAADQVEDEDAATLLYVADESDIEVSAESGMLPVADPELAADISEAAPAEPEAEWEDEIWAEPATVSLGEIALAAEEAEVLSGPEPDAEMLDGIEMDGQTEPWAQVDSPLADDAPIPFVPLRRRAEHLAARLAAGEVVETLRSEPEAEDDVVSLTELTPGGPGAAAAGDVGHGSGQTATEFVDADGMPLAVLDELALQEIVRQTLRAELQGELGERITRNVRKLVRAEINRALMARDLD
jgi:hypothetical protein